MNWSSPELAAITRWNELREQLNGRTTLGQVGVRDPEYVCELFDGQGYNGRGRCESDGHYLCDGCSELSPEAHRFTQYGRDGRRDRLRLFWRRHASQWDPK